MAKGKQYDELVWNYWARVVDKVASIIYKFLPNKIWPNLGITNDDVLKLAEEAVESGIIEDMISYAEKDPAAKNNYDYVYESCKGFEAMMYYRIAHVFLKTMILKHDNESKNYLSMLARKITEEAKVKTGIDINPACEIGKGCVIDHGVGTRIGYGSDYSENTNVFGETAIIGNDCTILNDVVIGAYEVNTGQLEGRRHPEIGNNVTICSGARVLGPVVIGHNVFIGTRVIINQDIPSNCKVTLQSQLQIIKKRSGNNIKIYGIIRGDRSGTLLLDGENLDDVTLALVELVDGGIYKEVAGPFIILSNSGQKVNFEFSQGYDIRKKEVLLRVTAMDGTEIYIYSEILNEDL